MDIQTTKLESVRIILENENPDFWNELSLAEQEDIKKGIEDLDNDKRVSYDSFLKKIS
jgi:hypothetical protein